MTNFDEVTNFRLINLFLFSISFSFISSILVDLKGELLQPEVISFFMILATLSVKTNDYFTKNFNLSQLYKLGNFVHLNLVLITFVYFYDKLLFIYIDSISVILETMIFSAYRIKLDVWLTNNNPSITSDYKVKANSLFADATLIGLFASIFVVKFFGIEYVISIFILYNIIFSIWLFLNWNFFENKMTLSKTTL